MKLDSFRELLVKKSDGDSQLQALVRFIREDVLADVVVESLEKMARAGHKGDAANLAIRDFGLEMDPELEPVMIHDALSHHASRYKAALKQLKDNPNDKDMKDVVNHHAGEIYKLVNMAEKTQKHTDGKLNISAPSPHAWERNIKPDKFDEESEPVKRGKKKVGQFANDTKGWNYNGSYKGNKYEFLTQKPNEHYQAEAEREGWNGPYPMENIQVNGKFLHIDDKIDPSELKNKSSHEFDSHPIMNHYSIPAKKRTPEHDTQYREQSGDFQDTIPDSWWDKHESFSADRGSKPSEPVHSHGVTLFGAGQGGNDEK